MVRPLKFKNPEELEKKINEYFEDADSRDEPYLFESLANWLDCDVKTLRNYRDKSDSSLFPTIIEKMRNKVHANWLLGGLTRKLDPRMVQLCLIASCPEYNPKQRMEISGSTYEDKLRIIEQRRRMALEMKEKEQIPDAEIIKRELSGMGED